MTWLLVGFAVAAGLFLLFFAWALMRAVPDEDYTAEEAERGKAPPLDEEEPR